MKPLTRPLAWIDLETTGLDFVRHNILQICCIVTDRDLNITSPVFERSIKAPESALLAMESYVQRMHKRTNLWYRCLQSKHTIAQVDIELHQFLKQHAKPHTATMAGSSVHFDRSFMQVHMPKSFEYLPYRILDVSSINEFGLRHRPDLMKQRPAKMHLHDAKSDILESIEELRWYRDNYFK